MDKGYLPCLFVAVRIVRQGRWGKEERCGQRQSAQPRQLSRLVRNRPSMCKKADFTMILYIGEGHRTEQRFSFDSVWFFVPRHHALHRYAPLCMCVVERVSIPAQLYNDSEAALPSKSMRNIYQAVQSTSIAVSPVRLLPT